MVTMARYKAVPVITTVVLKRKPKQTGKYVTFVFFVETIFSIFILLKNLKIATN